MKNEDADLEVAKINDMQVSWFLFVEDVEPEFVKNGKKQGNLFAKSFIFRLGQ
jgi:hypothetical protein